jgi:molecular chaperone DnaK
MYQQSGAAGQPGGDQFNGGQQQSQQQAGSSKAEDIQDADFEEVK